MKYVLYLTLLLSIITMSSSCEKDAGKLPNISFMTGETYTSADASVTGGTYITIGIKASKAEDKDVLKAFNISKSVNGGTPTTVFNKDFSGSEADTFLYDYTETVSTISGETDTYTFTVTNRDGLTNQVSLTILIQ